jgi:hypothetical protein
MTRSEKRVGTRENQEAPNRVVTRPVVMSKPGYILRKERKRDSLANNCCRKKKKAWVIVWLA